MFDFKSSVSKIDGWLTKREAEFLYQIARGIPGSGKIIEIGSWKGRSTICLGAGSRDGHRAKIYSIDPHTGSSEHRLMFGQVNTYREFLQNIITAGVHRFITPLKLTSQDAAVKLSGPVDFIFIDGAHEYSYVSLDYQLWFPRLKEGSKIAFHDSWHTPGVHLFTACLLLTSRNIRNPVLLDTLTVMEKVTKNTPGDRLYNALFVFYRLLIGWIGWIKMVISGTVISDKITWGFSPR